MRLLYSCILYMSPFKTFCFFMADTNEYMYELETDCRGTVHVRGRLLDITVGEIKSGTGKDVAIDQILKRLSVIGLASRVIVPEKVDGLLLNLHGEIFTSRSTWTSDEEYIEKKILDLRLKKVGSISVNCVTI